MPYTQESLSAYCQNHIWYKGDVEMINATVSAMKTIRQTDKPVPTDADKIIYIQRDGTPLDGIGYLERRDNVLSVCARVSEIQLWEVSDGSIHSSTGGGPWYSIMTEQEFLQQAEYVGKSLQDFYAWGRNQNHINFQAEVHVWKFTPKERECD